MMPEAAAANRSVFYAADGSMRSLAEIRERFRVKLEAGGKIENMKSLAPARWHAQASSSSGRAGAAGGGRPPLQMMDIQHMRTEEHTSELQSLMRISEAVFGFKKTK